MIRHFGPDLRTNPPPYITGQKETGSMPTTTATTAGACTGTVYPVNPDAPEEGHDVHHDGPCPVHPDPA